jgi:hypothetical protein
MTTPIRFIVDGERARGHNSSAGPDVSNRPVKDILAASGIDPDVAASDFGGFALPKDTIQEVATISDRSAEFGSAEVGQVVNVLSSGETYRHMGADKWRKLTDRSREEVNPKQFADVNWWDASGVLHVGIGENQTVTQAEIDAHTEWKGLYYAGLDTRDFVCMQEAFYGAFAGANGADGRGDIRWLGRSTQSRDVRIPGGLYRLNRSLWVLCLCGRITGAGRFVTTIQADYLDDSVIHTDGISYSHMSGFQLTVNNNVPQARAVYGVWPRTGRNAPLLDTSWFGQEFQSTLAGYAGHSGVLTVASASNPYIDVDATGGIPADDAWKDQYLSVCQDTDTSTTGPMQSWPKRIQSNKRQGATNVVRVYLYDGLETDTLLSGTAKVIIGGFHSFVEWSGNYGPGGNGTIFDGMAGGPNGYTYVDDFFAGSLIGKAVTVWNVTDNNVAPQQTTVASYNSRVLTLAAALTGSRVIAGNATSVDRRTGRRYVIGGTIYSVTGSDFKSSVTLNADLPVDIADNAGIASLLEVVSGVAKGQRYIVQRTSNAAGRTLYLCNPTPTQEYHHDHRYNWQVIPQAGDTIKLRSRPSWDIACQANTFQDLYVGGNCEVAQSIARMGDLAMGSENTWLNCHLNDASYAAYLFNGQNSIGNTIIGGDVQNCPWYGIYGKRGWFSVRSTSFENGPPGGQAGYDVATDQGHFYGVHITNVRTESGRFASIGQRASTMLNIDGITHQTAINVGAYNYADGMALVVGSFLYSPSANGVSAGTIWRVVYADAGTVDAGMASRFDTFMGSGVLGFNMNGGAGQAWLVCWNDNFIAAPALNLKNVSCWYGTIGINTGRNGQPGLGTWCTIDGLITTRRSPFSIISGAMIGRGVHIRNHTANPDPNNLNPITPNHHYYNYQSTSPFPGVNGTTISDPLALAYSEGALGQNVYDVGIAHAGPIANASSESVLATMDGVATGAALGNRTHEGKLPPVGNNQPGAAKLISGGQGTGSGAGGPIDFETAPAGAAGGQINPLVAALRLDTDTTAGNIRALLYDNSSGTMKRVSVGAADSGGAGFRLLRIPN